jgi:hypothetical protein
VQAFLCDDSREKSIECSHALLLLMVHPSLRAKLVQRFRYK